MTIANWLIDIENPVVRGHKVLGQYLLPGLAYIDLFFQAFQDRHEDPRLLELRNVSIYQPLVVSEDAGVSLVIDCVETQPGRWRLVVEGRSQREGATAGESKRYVTAEMHRVEPFGSDQTIDMAAVARSASRIVTLDEVYAGCREAELVHDEFMRARGKLYVTDSAIYVECGLSGAALESAEDLIFHPALIDGSAVCAGGPASEWLEETEARQLALPLFYESFRASERIQKSCIARIERASARRAGELNYYTLEFFDDAGRKIAELKNLAGKRVRDPASIDPRRIPGASIVQGVRARPASDETTAAPRAAVGSPTDAQLEIETFVRTLIAQKLNRPVRQIDPTLGYFEMGIDSAGLLELVQAIEAHVGAPLSPTLLFEHVTVAELSAHLAESPQVKAVAASGGLRRKSGGEASGAIKEIYTFREDEPFLRDHRVLDEPALMGITHPCLVLETYARRHGGGRPLELRNIRFRGGPVTLTKGESVHVSVSLADTGNGTSFKVEHTTDRSPASKPCCDGDHIGETTVLSESIDVRSLMSRARRLPEADIQRLYDRSEAFLIGPLLRTIEAVWLVDDSTQILKVSVDGGGAKGGLSDYLFDPLALSSCYYLYADSNQSDALAPRMFVPLAMERLVVNRRVPDEFYVIVKYRVRRADYVAFDASIVAENGEVIAAIANASLKEVSDPALLVNASFRGGRQETKAVEREDIAIIGLSGRYPMANTIAEYWENLRAGKDCITEIPAWRWDHGRYFDPEKGKAGKTYCKSGGFIDGVDEFDALFFNITPREAHFLDPQERLFLQCAYETFEDAGYTRETLKGDRAAGLGGNVGVFVGVMYEEYQLYGAQAQVSKHPYAVGGSASSVANRVSYFFNLHGPSMAVDTMCSSSLTAIHLACQSLRTGGCEMAIAGGVNVSIHPNKYLLLAQGQLASSTGWCVSFGQGGDGYVPGEGVGALLLKPLAKAVADADHIYGVIKGASINHGGKASAFAVPNPVAQAHVITQALREAKTDPRTISYVEAHGTGTSLGDPIEIAGLTRAFTKHTSDTQYCAIGSVKSNIGHLESAAGIAAVTKVLLQMRHRALVPSLHSATLNPKIDFNRTPFKVQQALTEWPRPTVTRDGRRIEHPRTAGVSSFGAGGANAHVILEEYAAVNEPRPTVSVTRDRPAAIVLSARSPECLQERARQLLNHLANDTYRDADLADIAYTLQVGREALEDRLAFTAATLTELREKLEIATASALSSRESSVFRGHMGIETDALFSVDDELREAIANWAKKGEYGRVLELWVKGLSFDWTSLYDGVKPRRISLPTYPFAKDRYWTPDLGEEASESRRAASLGTSGVNVLHPLLHANTSDFTEQRFTSTFTGQEFFLADHVVKGQVILPGVAHLEMARAAFERAGALASGAVITLKNVVWVRPVIVGDVPAEVHIRLRPEKDDEFAYEIYGRWDATASGESEDLLYSEGRVALAPAAEPRVVDLQSLHAQSQRATLTAEQCYEFYKSLGFQYGPAHRSMRELTVRADARGSDFVLARVELPEHLADTREEYGLHPSVLDGALQASIGLVPLQQGKPVARVALPFALDSLTVLQACPIAPWVHIRIADTRGNVQKIDVDLTDDTGAVCVEVRGFSSRSYDTEVVPPADADIPSAPTAEHVELMTFEERWEPQPLTRNSRTRIGTLVCLLPDASHEEAVRMTLGQLDPESRIILMTGAPQYSKRDTLRYDIVNEEAATYAAALKEIAAEHGTIDALLCLRGVQDPSSIGNYRGLIALVQGMDEARVTCARLMLGGRYESALARCHLDAWTTLGSSLKAVLPGTRASVIAWPCGDGEIRGWVDEWLPRLWAEISSSGSESVFYEQGERRVRRLHPTYRNSTKPVLRSGGTYLITGGAGGLGALFARHLSERYAANVIVTGRSELDAAGIGRLKALEAAGGKVIYEQADVADVDRMRAVVARAREQFGAITGIIHSAGVSAPDPVDKVSPAEFENVLSPKIAGTLALDAALEGEEPDFICYFSSLSAIMGDFGAASYAIGNRFQMAYAIHGSERPQSRSRHGRTKVLAVHWPLWAQGGMRLGNEDAYLQYSGQRALDAEQGLQVFEQLLNEPAAQQLVMFGVPARVHRWLGLLPKPEPVNLGRRAEPAEILRGQDSREREGLPDASSLKAQTVDYLKQLLGTTLQLPAGRIDAGRRLESYGMDSIVMLQVTRELEKVFGSLSKTLLFEYRSLEAVAEYLLENHRDALNPVLRSTAQSGSTRATASAPEQVAMPVAVGGTSGRPRRPSAPALQQRIAGRLPEPMSGRKRAVPAEISRGQDGYQRERLSEASSLKAQTVDYLKQLLGTTLQLPAARIDADRWLESYGMDSIVMLQVTRELEKVFGSLSKTLLFEHRSLEAVADYLLENHPDALGSVLGSTAQAVTTTRATASAPEQATPLAVGGKSGRPWRSLAPALPDSPAEEVRSAATGDIAIIGLSGRYPHADNVHEFWANLKAGADGITAVPAARWDHQHHADLQRLGGATRVTDSGGFISGMDSFDPSFFDIKDDGVDSVDCHEKLFLEAVWHLMEHAGYTSHHIKTRHQGNIGVYAGASAFVQAGFVTGMVAGRVAGFLRLNGPHLVVDSHSASATTALHLACQALTNGDCEVAIAGGVYVQSPKLFYAFGAWQQEMQADRRGFSDAGGVIMSEGVGAALLKPLHTAVRDGDQIIAIIKGTALISAGDMASLPPEPSRLADVIRKCLKKADIHPRTLGWAEPMAMGIPTGDYCEVAGFTKVFREQTADNGFCAMGTVESNIGHSLAACGIAQLTKVALQIHHGQLVPTIKADPMNPQINIADSPFHLQRSLEDWHRPQGQDSKRRGLFASRGRSGTLGAVVLEEHVADAQAEVKGGPADGGERLFLISAHSFDHLHRMARNLRDYVLKNPHIDLADVSYTTILRREPLRFRLAILASTKDELASRLGEHLDAQAPAAPGSRAKVLFADASADSGIHALLDAAEEKRLLETYLAEGTWSKLAAFWVRGSDLRSIEGVERALRGRFVQIPLYPFRERSGEADAAVS